MYPIFRERERERRGILTKFVNDLFHYCYARFVCSLFASFLFVKCVTCTITHFYNAIHDWNMSTTHLITKPNNIRSEHDAISDFRWKPLKQLMIIIIIIECYACTCLQY